MTSIGDLNKSVNLLHEKIDGLIGQTTNKYVTIDELEVASAKIINEFSNELEIASAKIIIEISKTISEKIDTCPCNKDILEAIQNITILPTKDKPKIDFNYRPPPPNFNYPKTENMSKFSELGKRK